MSDQNRHCINCGIASWRRNPCVGLHQIEDESILSVIQQWVAPQMVNSSQIICTRCRNLAIHSSAEELAASITGHQQVCVNCGRSLLRARSHLLRTDTERERRIHTVITEWTSYRTITSNKAHICHSCWVRADRNAYHDVSAPSGSSASALTVLSTSQSTPRPSEAIVLPDYIRAVETESRCFIVCCRRQGRNRVPVTTRILLLHVHKFYIPKNNRLCNHHIKTQSWDFLTGALENYVNVFTALHIQDMLELKSNTNTEALAKSSIKEF